MKKVIYYLFAVGIVLLFTTSCEEDKWEANQYAIKSVVSNGRTTSVYKYNQQGNIAEWQSLSHYVRYLYDNEGRLIKTESAIDPATLSSGVFIKKTELMTSENSIITSYQTFSYDAESRLSEIEHYTEQGSDFVINSKQSFDYDGEYISRKNIHDGEGRITQFRTYEYDDRGNVTEEKYYTYSLAAEPTLQSEFAYEYDDKNNPFLIFKALGNPGLYTNSNNIIGGYTISYHDVPDIHRNEVETNYFYNQHNYPVKVVNGDSEFEYTY